MWREACVGVPSAGGRKRRVAEPSGAGSSAAQRAGPRHRPCIVTQGAHQPQPCASVLRLGRRALRLAARGDKMRGEREEEGRKRSSNRSPALQRRVLFVISRRESSPEGLEKPVESFWAQAPSVVNDGHGEQPALVARPHHLHLSALLSEFDGVPAVEQAGACPLGRCEHHTRTHAEP